MHVLICGAGTIGQAIAYDMLQYAPDLELTMVDNNKQHIRSTQKFLNPDAIEFKLCDIHNKQTAEQLMSNCDIAISAAPYFFNYDLTVHAITMGAHFIDLGGNNHIVHKQCMLNPMAQDNKVTVIPDCGLAPGLVSIITHEIVDTLEHIDYVKIRVGGIPLHPKPPLHYELVFSAEGLINEYAEKALVLNNGSITEKKSLTALEQLTFPEPFGTMEAFLTSGGCSTLPHTYQHHINYLDYKTIRYPGHCEQIKLLFDLGFADTQHITINDKKITPRKLLIALLQQKLPATNQDAVLLKISSKGSLNNKNKLLTYTMIDTYDKKTGITAMMRTTAYPVSIIAQMIATQQIKKTGVYCPEHIAPYKTFFKALSKRGIMLTKNIIPI